MSETADRLFLYAAAMDIEPPVLEYEDGQLLITDALIAFCHREGINLDWALTGKPTKPLSPDFQELLDRLTPDERHRMALALLAHRQGMDIEVALRKYCQRD